MNRRSFVKSLVGGALAARFSFVWPSKSVEMDVSVTGPRSHGEIRFIEDPTYPADVVRVVGKSSLDSIVEPEFVWEGLQ